MAHPIIEKIKRVPPIVWFVVGGVVLAVLFLRFGGGGSSSQVVSGQGISGGGGGGNDLGTGESDIEPGSFGVIESILEGQAQQIADLGNLVQENAAADAEFRTSLTDQIKQGAPATPTPTPAPKPTPGATGTPVIPGSSYVPVNPNTRPLGSITTLPTIKKSTPTPAAPKRGRRTQSAPSLAAGRKALAAMKPFPKKKPTPTKTGAHGNISRVPAAQRARMV